MPSIPVDVLREILEHVDQKDLATLCRVNKIFCSCSRDVLYREIKFRDKCAVLQTLAKSTDLARRVRSFNHLHSPGELATALRNMSSLRRLNLYCISDVSVLDGCTFKLDSLTCNFLHSESLQRFLNSQPSLTHVTFYKGYEPLIPFDGCLPNLTRVEAMPSWLRILIPGRPVREVILIGYFSIDLSFFTLSTTPIQKLGIRYDTLYPKPVSLLVSIFFSLVHLEVNAYRVEWTVRVTYVCLSNG
jgi:hypothetical protein